MHKRMRLPHLRVHTNNHLESFFGHLKKSIKPTMGMAETVDTLIKDDRARANEYTHSRTKIGRYFHDSDQLLKFTIPFVAKSVETEYKLAVSKSDVFKFEEDKARGVIVVEGNTKEHEINMRT